MITKQIIGSESFMTLINITSLWENEEKYKNFRSFLLCLGNHTLGLKTADFSEELKLRRIENACTLIADYLRSQNEI